MPIAKKYSNAWKLQEKSNITFLIGPFTDMKFQIHLHHEKFISHGLKIRFAKINIFCKFMIYLHLAHWLVWDLRTCRTLLLEEMSTTLNSFLKLSLFQTRRVFPFEFQFGHFLLNMNKSSPNYPFIPPQSWILDICLSAGIDPHVVLNPW